MRKDPDLKSLRPGNRFYAITENARMLASKPPGEPPWLDQVTLAPVSKGIATVTEASVHWDFRSGLFHSYVDFPKKPSGNKVATGFSLHRWRLRSWYDAGTAAGHHGDLYDNFDKDHSQLNCYQFPQLTRLEYDGEARARNLTSGLQNRFVHHGAVVFGNSAIRQPRKSRPPSGAASPATPTPGRGERPFSMLSTTPTSSISIRSTGITIPATTGKVAVLATPTPRTPPM